MAKQNLNNLRYFFTEDTKNIQEYLDLRTTLTEQDKRFVGFREFSDINDHAYYFLPETKVLVVYDENKCVGGCCLINNNQVPSITLPLQTEMQTSANDPVPGMEDIFSTINLNNKIYGEFNRIAIDTPYRNIKVVKRIFSEILKKCYYDNVQYLFGVGDTTRAKLYCHIFKNLGLEVVFHSDIHVPLKEDHEGVQMFLMSANIEQYFHQYAQSKIMETQLETT
tara:strand:- start:64 stop:732 length:669 start_codon:yes stop_codon:yes gene_type:complete